MRTFLVICVIVLGYCAEAQSVVVASDSARKLDLGLGHAIITVPSAQSGNAFSQLELVEYPGYATPLHVHDKSVETFYVLKGTLTLLGNGLKQQIGEGGTATIAIGTPHAQGNFTKVMFTS